MPGKRFVKNKIVAFLHNKLKTEVIIGELGYGLPKYISLKNVLFRDQANDTLLSAGTLVVNINMLKLITGKIDVQHITLEGLHSHIYRKAPDTNFNFTYIINAFSGSPKKEKVKDSASSPTSIDINRITLKNIHARFDDETGGTSLAVNLNSLELRMKKTDLNEMNFHVKELSVNGLQTVFLQDSSYPPTKVDTTTRKAPFHLVADALKLENIIFRYGDNRNKFLLDVNLGKLYASARNIDLAEEKIDISKFDLSRTAVKITLGKHSPVQQKVNVILDTLPQSKWRVLASTLNLKDINFAFNNENKPRQQYGMDYAHLNVKQLTLNSHNILYSADSIIGNVRHLALKEQSGLDLKELKTVFAYHMHGGYLRNLYLETPNTLLQDYIDVQYPSLDTLKKNMETMRVNARLQKSIVGLSDILIFAPDLRKQELFRKYKNEKLLFEAVFNGYLNKLAIKNFYVSGLHNTIVHVNGKMNGLPDMKKIKYDFNIIKIQSSNKDVTAFVPPSALKQIQVPNTFSALGKLSGTIQDYNTNLVIISSDGAAKLNGYVYMSPGKGREKYDIHLNTDKLNIGRILRQDSLMGAITAMISAKGQSFDIHNMNTVVKGDISSAGFMNYVYNSIKFNGSIAQQLGKLSLVSNDPNAVLQLDADADFTQKDPALKAKLNIDSANLQALKLYTDEMRIRAAILADIPKLSADYPEGLIVIDKPTMTMKGERYFLDSLYISSKPTTDSGQNIIINADAIVATLTGKTPLSQIGNIIQEHISRHYKLKADSNKLVKTIPGSYDLQLNATIQDRPLLHAVLPGLQSMDTININAAINPRTLVVNATMPHVVYNNNTLDSGKVNINGTDSALTYNISLNKLATPDIQLWQTTAQGRLNGNEITADIAIADSAKKERFALNAKLQQNDKEQVLQLGNDLVLNYKKWQVSQPNKIVFSAQGFYAQNFGFTNGSESINLNSEQADYSAPLTVSVNNFLLSNITEIVQKDTLLANGVLNSKLVVQNVTTTPKASGTLQIQNLSVREDTIGNLDVQLTEASANEAKAKITIIGNGNDIAVTGSYYPKPVSNNNFDLKLDINALNLKTVEGLAMNSIRRSSGLIKGSLTVKGTPALPVITGDVYTDNLTTTVSMLGTPMRMQKEKIIFTADGITFDNFKILDSFGNSGVIVGNVKTKDYRDMQFALQLKSKKWQVLNSTVADNKLFYGRMVLTTNLSIKGTPQAPLIDGSLTVHDTTKFTVAIPQKKAEIQDRDGVVEFVDIDDSNRYTLLTPKDTMPKIVMRSGAKLDVNITIQKNAEFNVIIDESTGDFLRVRGEAALNTVINPDGTIGLAGTYELKQGTYELNYNLIKRKFNIQDGSTITFAGDPLQAEANITAAYTANVPPYDLVEKQVSDPAQLNYYKQRLTFDVQLKLKGPLLKPEISFDIVLPEEKKYRTNSDVITTVQGKLSEMRNNPSELNKQVFALLILNRFVAENPFESGAGGKSVEFMARQSASRFLSEQLNAVAGRLINGLELNLDLESTEDYTTGEKRNKTDLNVSASKRLLNDRLTVTVGNNFGLEGQNQNTNKNSSLVPGNLAADYQLSTDGRYMVRIYRKNEIQDIVEGYVVETGVSFIVTVDYNRFKTLFRKRKPDVDSDNQKETDKKGGTNN